MRSRPWFLSIVVVVLANASPATAQAVATDHAAAIARLQSELAAQFANGRLPGFSIAVVVEDEIVYAEGFGLRNVAEGLPATPETIYAAGSTTKAFTAALLATLVDEGRLGWDDHVRDHLPEFTLRDEVANTNVTVRDLLCHRTGLLGLDLLWASGTATWDDIHPAIARAEPIHGYGETFKYNNVMFLAGGEAAARCAGVSWSQLMQDRWLGPLGMSASSLTIDAMVDDPNAAIGYEWNADDETFEATPMRRLDNIAPAGALNTTVVDMAQWVRLQLSRGRFGGLQLVTPVRFEEMWAPHIDMRPGASYGLGWVIGSWRGKRVVEHGGNIDGFSAQVAFLPEQGIGFALLMNVGRAPVQSLSIPLVFDAWFDRAPAEVAETTPLDRYAGVYRMDALNADLTVSVRDGRLAIDVPGQMVYDTTAADDDGWRQFRGFEDITFRFDENDAGEVVGMRMRQNGMTFELPRRGIEPDQRVVEVTEDDARAWRGLYRSDLIDDNVEVIVKDGQLAVDVPGQMAFAMHPPDDAGRRFFRATDTIWVRFEENDAGVVTGLTMSQNGAEFTLPRVGDALDDLPTPAEIERRVRERADSVAYEQLYNLRLGGRITLVNQGVTGTSEVLLAGYDRVRHHVDLSPFAWVKMSWIGGRGWRDASFEQFHPMEGDELAQAQRLSPVAFLGPWSVIFDAVEVLAVHADESGSRTYQVRGSREGLPETMLFIDADTSEIRRVEGATTVGKVTVPTTTILGDYRRVDGVGLPFRIETRDDLNGTAIYEITSVETNLELAEEPWVMTPPADG